MPKTQEDLEKEQKILEHKRQLEEDAIKKDLDERYPNYRNDWEYDPYRHIGKHIPTGFLIGDVFLDIGRRFECHNLREFSLKMKAQGMSSKEADMYRRDLINQFYFIDISEAIWTPKPKTFKEELADEEDNYQWRIKMAEKYGRTDKEKEGIHQRHEEHISQIYQKFGIDR